MQISHVDSIFYFGSALFFSLRSFKSKNRIRVQNSASQDPNNCLELPRFAQNRHKKSAVIVVMREEAHAAIQLQFVVNRWRGKHFRTNLSSEDTCYIE